MKINHFSHETFCLRPKVCRLRKGMVIYMNNPIEIGNRIKVARRSAHLSQTELANKLEKTLRTVQKYESGEIEPSIATINDIAKALSVSPAELIGYHKQEIQLDTLSDVLFVLNELNKKAGLHFDVDVRRPPKSEDWTCSLLFNGNNSQAELNSDLCLFLERYAEENARKENYFTDQEYFDHWFETELTYYANIPLADREIENLSSEERIKRRNELDRMRLEETKKAAKEDDDN